MGKFIFYLLETYLLKPISYLNLKYKNFIEI